MLFRSWAEIKKDETEIGHLTRELMGVAFISVQIIVDNSSTKKWILYHLNHTAKGKPKQRTLDFTELTEMVAKSKGVKTAHITREVEALEELGLVKTDEAMKNKKKKNRRNRRYRTAIPLIYMSKNALKL